MRQEAWTRFLNRWLSLVLFSLGVVYFLARMVVRDLPSSGLTVELVVYGTLTGLLCYLFRANAMVISNPAGRVWWLLFLVLSISGAFLLKNPLLAGTVWDESGRAGYMQRLEDGSSVPLANLRAVAVHRQGRDGHRTYLAAGYVKAAGGHPGRLRELYREARGDERFLLEWHFSHHPPGYPLLMAPLYPHHGLMRIAGFATFMLCCVAVGLAIRAFGGTPRSSISVALTFASIPTLWRAQALFLSIDLATALPALIATAALFTAARRGPDGSRFALLAILASAGFGLSSFIKYSSAYWAGAAGLAALLFFGWRRNWCLIAWIGATVAASLFFGGLYTWQAWGSLDFTILQALFGEPDPESVAAHARPNLPHWLELARAGRLLVQFVGPPLLGLTQLMLVDSIRHRPGRPARLTLLVVCALPILLVFPGSFRFALPAAALVFIGLRAPEFLQALTPLQRAAVPAVLLSFAFTKFIGRFYLGIGA